MTIFNSVRQCISTIKELHQHSQPNATHFSKLYLLNIKSPDPKPHAFINTESIDQNRNGSNPIA